MTEEVFADMMAKPGDDDFDAMDPENVSPLVVWLGSAESSDVTGRVFEVEGGVVSVADGWHHGPRRDKGARWAPAELGPVVRDLLAEAPRSGPGLRSLNQLEQARERDRNHAVHGEAGAGEEDVELRPRALAPAAGVDEHLEVDGLHRVIAGVLGEQLLEHEHPAVRRERLPAATEERDAGLVVPVVHDRLEHVAIAALGDRDEEVPTDNVDPVRDARGRQHGCRARRPTEGRTAHR